MGQLLRSEDGALGIGEFFVAAMVAAVVDEFLGSGEIVLRRFPRVRFLTEEEAGAVKVDVGQREFHWAAVGDFPGFVQVALRAFGAGANAGERAQPSAGLEAESDETSLASAAEAVHGLFSFGFQIANCGISQDSRVERGAGPREIV